MTRNNIINGCVYLCENEVATGCSLGFMIAKLLGIKRFTCTSGKHLMSSFNSQNMMKLIKFCTLPVLSENVFKIKSIIYRKSILFVRKLNINLNRVCIY